MWASARGDDRSVTTLLGYGADPSIVDLQGSGPLIDAAARSHPVCVRLLLEAGADPDPTLIGNMRKGSPLNCAARIASDVLVLYTLPDFGADIELCGVGSRTSLIYAARNGIIDSAMILLEYNADINATSI